MLDAHVRTFIAQFVRAYPSLVLRDRERADTDRTTSSARPSQVEHATPTVLDSLRRMLTRAWVLAHDHSVTDAHARLLAIADWWPRLPVDGQASIATSVNDAILHDLSFGVEHGVWMDDAVTYVTQLMQRTDESWALALRQHDAAGRWLLAAGRAYNGDSLRYVSELTTEWWRDHGDRLGLLAAARLAQGDTTGADDIWRRQWDAYGRGDARSAQSGVALRLLAAARQRGDLAAAARYAGDAFLVMDHHDGQVTPALAALTAQLDTLYRLAYRDSTSAGRTRYLDALFHQDVERSEAFPVTPYTGPRQGRTVLLSTMTWVDCGGCRSRDQALDALNERYQSHNVFVLVHHYEVPFVTPGASDDGAGWTVEHGLTPPPYDRVARDGPCGLMHLNGGCPSLYASDADIAGAPLAPRLYDMMVPRIDQALQQPSLGAMQATVRMVDGHVTATVRLDTVAAWPRPLKLQIALVEDSLHFQGGNNLRIWRMVPRRFAGDSASGFGFVVPSSHQGVFHAEFDVARVEQELRQKNEWIDRQGDRRRPENADEMALRTAAYTLNPAQLYIMVFVHDALTGEVLHTTMQPVSTTKGDRP